MDAYYNQDDIMIYRCDNLELLRSIPSEKVNLIYCDILYNTGKKFDDYDDNLGSPEEATEWYRERFEEMKRILTQNGSIFIHCNWRLDSYMRILLDEIFGTNCFRNRIYRKHSEERGFYSNFDSQVDIILYYVKNPKDFVFNEIYSSTPRIVPLFENGIVEGKDDVRICKIGISDELAENGADDVKNPAEVTIDLRSKNKHWLVSQKQFYDMLKNDEVKIIDGLPYRFSCVVPIGNLWDEPEMLDQYTRTGIADAYDTPKPEAVLERILKMCSNEGDVVADFFLGGGTTAVVTKKLKRKGIFCDISKKACDVTIEKLNN